MSLKDNQRSSQNQKAWDQIAPVHAKHSSKKELLTAPYVGLSQFQINYLKKLNLKNKKVAHLCCNDGREILGIKKMGAKSVTGFDFSQKFIDHAKKLSSLTGIEGRFIRSDVTKISPKFHQAFDIIVITTGTLVWFKDLNKLFKNVFKLLNLKGTLFIQESHPALRTYQPSGNSLKVTSSYFDTGHHHIPDGVSYFGSSQKPLPTQHLYFYTISDLINSLISQKLSINSFQELPQDSSFKYKKLEPKQLIPMSYVLTASKLA